MSKTLEQVVAESILQQPTDTITVDGHTFEVTPATPATLIMISQYVSLFPVVDTNTENIMYEVLATAKDMEILGKICAIFIIGAKRIKEHRKITLTRNEEYTEWSWRKFRKVVKVHSVSYEVDELDWLAEKILNEVTNETLTQVVAKRLSMMQISDFFALTTSLSEANQLKRTKEVVETASGVKS